MPAIHVRRGAIQPPLGYAELDTSFFLYNDLVMAWDPVTQLNLKTEEPPIQVLGGGSTDGVVNTNLGYGRKFNGSAYGLQYGNTEYAVNRAGITHLIVVSDLVMPTWGGIISTSDASGNASFSWQRSNNLNSFYLSNANSGFTLGDFTKLTQKTDVLMATMPRQGISANGEIYVNGFRYATSVAGTTAASYPRYYNILQERTRNATYNCTGVVHTTMMFRRQITRSEAIELSANPWQAFRFSAHRIYSLPQKIARYQQGVARASQLNAQPGSKNIKINYDNSITQGLYAATVPGLGCIVNNTAHISSPNATITASKDLMITQDATGAAGIFFPKRYLQARTELFIMNCPLRRTYGRWLAFGSNDGFNGEYSNTEVGWVIHGTAWNSKTKVFNGQSPITLVGGERIIVGTWSMNENSGLGSVFVNGVSVTNQSGVAQTTPSVRVQSTAQEYGGPAQTAGTGISLFLAWDRVLSASEIRSISENPWQVFTNASVVRSPIKRKAPHIHTSKTKQYQPTGGVELDPKWSNAHVAILGHTPTTNYGNSQSNYRPQGSGIIIRSNAYGAGTEASSYTSTGYWVSRTANPFMDNWPGVTVISEFVVLSDLASSTYPSISSYVPAGEFYGGWNLTIEKDTANRRLFYWRAGNNSTALCSTGYYGYTPPADEYAVGDHFRVVCTFSRDKARMEFHSSRNGVPLMSVHNLGTSPGWRNMMSTESIGGYYRTTHRALHNPINLVAVLPYAVESNTCRELLDNPYQIFRSTTRKVIIGPGMKATPTLIDPSFNLAIPSVRANY